MQYEYLKFVANLDDLKAQYRALCRIHHPDLGGNTAAMQKLNAEYEERLRSGLFNEEYADTHTSADIESALREVIEKTCVFKHLSIEICGRWIWFTGETWRYKRILKDLGCKWASKKGAWYWRPADEKSKRRGSWPLDKIRAKYGSQAVNMKYREEVAA